MKKTITAFIIALLLSCSGNKLNQAADANQQIVGKWESNHVYTKYNDTVRDDIEFLPDGTYKEFSIIHSPGLSTDSNWYEGKYSYSSSSKILGLSFQVYDRNGNYKRSSDTSVICNLQDHTLLFMGLQYDSVAAFKTFPSRK